MREAVEHCEDCSFFNECNEKDYVCPAAKRLLIILQETKEEATSTLQKLVAKGEIIEIIDGDEKTYTLPKNEKKEPPGMMFG